MSYQHADGQAAGAGSCALCRRMVAELTRHHLIPRCRRDRRRRRADPQAELVTVDLCRPCHHHIHTVCSEAELERTYPTLSALAAHPEVAAFIAWIARRPDGAHVPAASKKRR